jgi:ElaB/YqjD/DUF883 family membrane-anchored ribosome-binding protein
MFNCIIDMSTKPEIIAQIQELEDHITNLSEQILALGKDDADEKAQEIAAEQYQAQEQLRDLRNQLDNTDPNEV